MSFAERCQQPRLFGGEPNGSPLPLPEPDDQHEYVAKTEYRPYALFRSEFHLGQLSPFLSLLGADDILAPEFVQLIPEAYFSLIEQPPTHQLPTIKVDLFEGAQMKITIHQDSQHATVKVGLRSPQQIRHYLYLKLEDVLKQFEFEPTIGEWQDPLPPVIRPRSSFQPPTE